RSAPGAAARAACSRPPRAGREPLSRAAPSPPPSAVNRRFLVGVARLLGISTCLTWSMDYQLPQGRAERLISLCRQAGATTYISGPTARDYLDPAVFAEAGIQLVFMDYARSPRDPPLHPPFPHQVSVVDLLLNAGPAARACMTSTASLTPA